MPEAPLFSGSSFARERNRRVAVSGRTYISKWRAGRTQLFPARVRVLVALGSPFEGAS
jgi:hypothetical protein